MIAMSGIAQGGSDKFRKTVFKARLSGANEVPPVETETTGKATFVARGDSIDFELEVDDADGVSGAAEALVESMRQGRTYVNVHSAPYPGGVVRGQIVKA